MKKVAFLCLLFVGFFPSLSFAKTHPLPGPGVPAFRLLTIPVFYNRVSKATVLYVPCSCTGMINEAVTAEGDLTISASGKIENGHLSVLVKVDFKGNATTAIEGITYSVSGTPASSVTKNLVSEPVDVFVKGHFKLEGRNKPSRLFISDLGYITVYPDGTVTNHILDPKNDPDYSHPKVHCSEPKEG
jgi:hypothetical protein